MHLKVIMDYLYPWHGHNSSNTKLFINPEVIHVLIMLKVYTKLYKGLMTQVEDQMSIQ